MRADAAASAKARLVSAGFKVKISWISDPAPTGKVIAQKPSGGTAPSGSTIVLTVSTGRRGGTATAKSPVAPPSASTANDDAAARAFRTQTSGLRLAGAGVVTKVLSDDNNGDRHQRFILRLSSGQTLLVAHNIDIAPRLPSLAPGDTVAFSGIYEWNSQGGTVHWTHRDPSGRHPAGWLKYKGATFR